MISIQKYLQLLPEGSERTRGSEELCESLAALSSRLMGYSAVQMAARKHPALSGISAQMSSLRSRLEETAEPAKIAGLGDEAAEVFRQYRETLASLEKLNTEELQRMVTMLNATVAVLSAGSERSLTRLKQLESDLQQTSAIQDIVALRSRLSDCLQYVRTETELERSSHSREMAQIEQARHKVQESVALARCGTAGRVEAEASLSEHFKSPSMYVIVVVLTRVRTVATRFGASVADRFVQLFAHDLVELLPSPKSVFRWSEQTLVVQVVYSGQQFQLKAEVQKDLASISNTRRMEIGQRTAMLLNTHQWTLFRLAECTAVEEAVKRIEMLGGLG